MKPKILLPFCLSVAMLFIQSCSKSVTTAPATTERNLQFVLYTNEDFSDDDHNITFSVFVRDDNNTLLDSAIETMKVKDIPGQENKIIINKKITTAPSTQLMAGFVYEIEHVGVSWYLDTVAAGQSSKTIEYSFK